MFSHLPLAPSETLHRFHRSILPEVTDHTKSTETGNQASWVHYKAQKTVSSTHLKLAKLSLSRISVEAAVEKAGRTLCPNFTRAFSLQTTEMKGARLFVLLSSLWSGGLGLTNTTHTWTIPEDGNPQKNMTTASVPLNEIQSLQMLPTAQTGSAERAATPEARSSEESLLKSALLPMETSASPEGVRNQTLTPTEETAEGALKSQTPALLPKSSIQFSPRAASAVLPDSTLKFLQSFAKNLNQQASPLNSAGGVGNRSPRETYLSRGDNSGGQRTNSQKSSFETTRGK